MNKIIFNLYYLWFLCKIKLNAFYFSKNIIFNKLIIFYFYTYCYKQNNKKNSLFFLNVNKSLNLNSEYFLINYNSYTYLLKHFYTYAYLYLFFNQKFIELNKLNFFNKFLNKYYYFFFSCFKNFFNNELVFYKNLNINFLEVAFKNLKKFSKINDSKFFRKNLFSKVYFFKLKKLNERIKYFNKNVIFYLYFFKKYKNPVLLNRFFYNVSKYQN